MQSRQARCAKYLSMLNAKQTCLCVSYIPVSIASPEPGCALTQNMRQYLTGLTANLAKHTITDVKLDQRISVLLKDSFIESFAPRERLFVRQFVVRSQRLQHPHVPGMPLISYKSVQCLVGYGPAEC